MLPSPSDWNLMIAAALVAVELAALVAIQRAGLAGLFSNGFRSLACANRFRAYLVLVLVALDLKKEKNA